MSRLVGKKLAGQLLQYLKMSPENQEGKAILFVTVDSDGWPHVAMLSSWEVFATDARNIKIATYASSTTTRNLKRNGRATIVVIDAGLTYYIKGTAILVRVRLRSDRYNSLFNLEVEGVLKDSLPGARITGGIAFERAKGAEEHGPLYEEISKEHP
jgi:hypothetical protein